MLAERSLPSIENILKGLASPDPENKLYVNLRAIVQQRLKLGSDLSGVDFEFKVVHLSEKDRMVISANCRKGIEDLKEEFRTRFPEAQCSVELIGPSEMSGIEIVRPSEDWFRVRLSAVPLQAAFGDRPLKMYLGVGHLSDLVDLYNRRRDDLFSRNIRYFLRSRKNEERGPSGKIRDSLQDICVSPKETSPHPEMFAFYHNGVTLFARDVRIQPDDGTIVGTLCAQRMPDDQNEFLLPKQF